MMKNIGNRLKLLILCDCFLIFPISLLASFKKCGLCNAESSCHILLLDSGDYENEIFVILLVEQNETIHKCVCLL